MISADPITLVEFLISSIDSFALAPDATAIQFSPSSDTKICATPEGASESFVT